MNIPISQPPEDIAGDLTFTQPRYHFGQIVEDKKGESGFVIGMDFDSDWHYTLFYSRLNVVSKRIIESHLAISTTQVAAMSDAPAMLLHQSAVVNEG